MAKNWAQYLGFISERGKPSVWRWFSTFGVVIFGVGVVGLFTGSLIVGAVSCIIGICLIVASGRKVGPRP
jgi:uncharacterized membrane protein YjjP (DUF1212 family)